MSEKKVSTDVARELVAALRAARFGLQAAGADRKIRKGRFVPTDALALREVEAALAKVANQPWAAEPPEVDGDDDE